MKLDKANGFPSKALRSIFCAPYEEEMFKGCDVLFRSDEYWTRKDVVLFLDSFYGDYFGEVIRRGCPDCEEGRGVATMSEEDLFTRYVYDPFDSCWGYHTEPPTNGVFDSIFGLLTESMGINNGKRKFNVVHLADTSDFEEVKKKHEFVFLCDQYGHTTAIYIKRNNILILQQPTALHVTEEMAAKVKRRISKILTLLSAAVPKTVRGKIAVPKFNIGLDIEFSVVDSDGVFHPATEFVADTEEAPIGTDGNVETLEIRPKYDKDPLALVENLEELLSNVNSIMPKGYDVWSGGGEPFHRSTGTHIHFSGISTDRKRENEIRPLVKWLDCLITTPVLMYMRGTARADKNYGRLGDYRNSNNHNGFTHHGFEWRVLPTAVPNKKFAQGLFCLSYMIVCAYEMGMTVEFDEKNFSLDWYKNLPLFEKYEDYIKYFVDYVKSGETLEVPTLAGWFKKEFKKDSECDVKVIFANDREGYLAISGYTGYNPQKVFDQVVFYEVGDGNAYLISERHASLMRYFTASKGEAISVRDVSSAMKAKYGRDGLKTLFFGIPSQIIRHMAGRSHGSRNAVKMFSQDIIKNI